MDAFLTRFMGVTRSCETIFFFCFCKMAKKKKMMVLHVLFVSILQDIFALKHKSNAAWINIFLEQRCPQCDHDHCFLFFLFFNVFIYFWENETQSEQGRCRERNRERETQNPKQGSRLRAVNTEPDVEFQRTNREIMTWAQVRCSTDWATSGGPHHLFLIC